MVGVYSYIVAKIVRARADIVATKLSIILTSFSSFHVSTSKYEGGQLTGAKRRDTALIFMFFGWLWQAECQ